MILQLHRESHKVCLKMNMNKTKVMFNNYILCYEIEIDDEVIECVQEYTYLRQRLGVCPDHEKKIKRGIGMG